MTEYPTKWVVEDRGPASMTSYGHGASRFVVKRTELKAKEVNGAYANDRVRAEELANLMNGAR